MVFLGLLLIPLALKLIEGQKMGETEFNGSYREVLKKKGQKGRGNFKRAK